MHLANLLTASRFLLAAFFMLTFLDHSLLGFAFAFLFVLLAMLSDFFDGYVARKQGTNSDFGKLFDPIADAFFFLLVFFTFAFASLIPWWLVLPFVLRECTQHFYIRPQALRYGVALQAKFIGKVKTTLQFVAVLLVILLEGLRFFDWWLIRFYRTDQLFALFDWLILGLVLSCAIVSVFSIIPYIFQLFQIRKKMKILSSET